MMVKFMDKDILSLQINVFIKAVYIKEKCMAKENCYFQINQNILENLKGIVYKAEVYMKPILQFQDGYYCRLYN